MGYKKNNIPWNKDKKGLQVAWNKGLTKEIDERVRKYGENGRGKTISDEHKKIIGDSNRGRIWSEEMKSYFSEIHKGKLCGDKNPMKRPEVIEKRRKSIVGKYIGENAFNWRGGLSSLPYCKKWTPKLKEVIRKRDNYQCQNPDCLITQLESKVIYGKVLIPHHIHYDKENCYPDLITLCHRHNVKANFNRDYWEQLYMKVLEKQNLLNYFGDLK